MIARVQARRASVLFRLLVALGSSEQALAVDDASWNQVPAGPKPASRYKTAMAYDSTRGVAVLFGGSGSLGYHNDTWEWTGGSKWIERTSVTRPPARDDHAMAYDSVRGRVVLFGGFGPSESALGDTWEWNGSTWVQRTPAVSPSPRVGHAMSYDSARGRVVLFGGITLVNFQWVSLADTWEWDGSNWVERTPSSSPPARYAHAMAYDSVRGRVVLFGGYDSSFYGDTWEWDGSDWVERTPATHPSARGYHAMTYDSGRSRVVLVAGIGSSGSLSSTWEWNGSTWVQSVGEGVGGNGFSPPPRYEHALAYDSARGVALLFGGDGTNGLNGDTWQWDGIRWVERIPPNPPRRDEHAMAYDSDRARAVVFGGSLAGTTHLADTWEWDGGSWIARAPAVRPSPRTEVAMVYDSARHVIVLFGGLGASTTFADTWEWNGSTWVQRTPATSPPARYGHAMAYDSARGRVVLFGGYGINFPYPLADTWEWNGSNWLQHTPLTSPSGRRDHAMAYDAARGRVVLFSGYGFVGGGASGHPADTWEWDGVNWFQRTPAPSPSGREAHAMAYDSARELVVLFGGSTTGQNALADTWEWNGNGWVQRTPPLSPFARREHAMAYDGLRGRVVLFGGTTITDTWLYFDATGTESCNGLDDDGDAFLPSDEVDQDGDGWVGCSPWSGSDPAILGGGDCRPTDPSGYPGAPELCDGTDSDCNGLADETDADSDGFRPCSGDCDDHQASIFPGSPQVCDFRNNDCLDPEWPLLPDPEFDDDLDTFSECQDDCDDHNPNVGPAATEVCNSIDDDCDGFVDEDALGFDTDGDGVHNRCDNCVQAVNPQQLDQDVDGVGDACDACPADPLNDRDGDTVCGGVDNCPTIPNADQADGDGDSHGDDCDNCPSVPNAGQADSDGELARIWASAAVASSEYSSGDYSAMQSTGSPESEGVCQDVSTNWSPLGSTADPEWLELSYAAPLKAIGVDVHESFEQRFVKQIDLRDTGGMYHVAWSATDGTTCGGVLEARWPITDYLVDGVVVRTAVQDWEEIDAVALVGVFDAADNVGNACDNCPELANPSQADGDGDGAGNECDCAVGNSAVRPAAEVSGLRADSPAAGVLRLIWNGAAGASTYAILRGQLSALSATHQGDCQVDGLAALEWEDPELPAPGHGFAYLVRGDSPVCGAGTLGFGAYGVARVNIGSACPE